MDDPILIRLGPFGDHSGQHQDLRVHACLLGKVAAAEPEVVPAHLLDSVDFFVVLGVGLRLQKLSPTIFGIPWNLAVGVQGVPSVE